MVEASHAPGGTHDASPARSKRETGTERGGGPPDWPAASHYELLRDAPHRASVAEVVGLQRALGNQAVGQVLHRAAETRARAQRAPDGDQGTSDDARQRQREKAEKDLATLFDRTKGIPQLDDESKPFKFLMRQYVDLGLGGPTKKDKAVAALNQVLSHLEGIRAFEVGGKTYRSISAEGGLEDAAQELTENVMLWSKLNKWQPLEAVAGGEKGLTLEATLAGKLFDGLNFGMDYKTSETLQNQWKKVSDTFVHHAKGIVHAQVLEGIHPDSVLTTTEWPVIQKLMRSWQVLAFVVHIFEYDEENDQLVEMGQRTIYHPSEWLSLPSISEDEWSDEKQQFVRGSEFTKRQDRAYKSEEKRHAAKEAEEKRTKAKELQEKRRWFVEQARARFEPYQPSATSK